MSRLNIAMLIPGMAFSGKTLSTQSLGGSETAGAYMAKALSALGHKVYVFCNCPEPGEYDGVVYTSIESWNQFAPLIPHDVTIVQRLPQTFSGPMASKLNILWCHDLAQARHSQEFLGVTWNIDKVAVVSEFMKLQYIEALGLPGDLVWATRNGVDLKVIPEEGTRDHKQLFYSARPERGLDVLLRDIFPRILEKEPGAKLNICGYNNQAPELEDFYRYIEQLVTGLGDSVRWHGFLSKPDLYRLYSSGGVYIYPTPSPVMKQFREVSCISLMESMACGMPVVCSDNGALPETSGGAARLIAGDPDSAEYQQKFADSVVELMRDNELWQRHSNKGKQVAQTLSWDAVAQDWTKQFNRWIRERNDDPARLVTHFMKRSDIVAAEHVLEKHPGISRPDDLRLYEFKQSRETFIQHYAKVAQGHQGNWEDWTNDPRYQALLTWCRKALKPGMRVLDLGCAYGFATIPLANEFPDITFIGLDLDEGSIKHAQRYAQKHAKHSNIEFFVGDENSSSRGRFDVLICDETLEHQPEPAEFLARAQSAVKDGGLVHITVPYGPWEQMSYGKFPYRCHLWEFDVHDLSDLIGEKKASIFSLPVSISEINGAPLGYNIATYQTDGTPPGQIDMERKISLQRPTQTLSANIIAGPGAEQTLHWCLMSVLGIADEIIFANTGMTAEGVRIANQYPVRIIPAPDPKVAGFEAPRNLALEQSTSDFVLWIDTDEHLLSPQSLPKYLRQNDWQGYGIRQHHFSVDANFSPDMPVRLFRTAPRDGKKMRFYGMIHEHPELALNEGPGPIVVLSDVHIAHVGYLYEPGRQKRFWRNYPLLMADKEKYPERILQKHMICRDNMLLVQYALSRGEPLNEELRARCRETIELYREYFLGKHVYAGLDTVQYYSDALRILGEGIDVEFSVQASKGEKPLNGSSIRFANAEDVRKEVEWRLDSELGKYDSAHW